jgi:hypothetical protein
MLSRHLLIYFPSSTFPLSFVAEIFNKVLIVRTIATRPAHSVLLAGYSRHSRCSEERLEPKYLGWRNFIYLDKVPYFTLLCMAGLCPCPQRGHVTV